MHLNRWGSQAHRFNILKADINLQQEGLIVLELIGHKAYVEEGLRYLKSVGVQVEKVAASIRRDDKKCFQCGACGLCVAVYPVRAMAVCLEQGVELPA